MSNQELENSKIIELKKMLATFTRKEPYISNTAMRIAILFDKEHSYEPITSKELEKAAYKRGYNTGYQAARRARGDV